MNQHRSSNRGTNAAGVPVSQIKSSRRNSGIFGYPSCSVTLLLQQQKQQQGLFAPCCRTQGAWSTYFSSRSKVRPPLALFAFGLTTALLQVKHTCLGGYSDGDLYREQGTGTDNFTFGFAIFFSGLLQFVWAFMKLNAITSLDILGSSCMEVSGCPMALRYSLSSWQDAFMVCHIES